jgi:mono/diheme cytochrome c family protein
MKNFSCPLATLALLALFSAIPAKALPRDEAERAGAVLFRDKGCAYCHGAMAQGTTRGPSLANVRKSLKAPQIAGQIENGGQKMPAFKDSLSQDEVDQLVSFLRAKHRPVPPLAPVSAPLSNPAQ